jgi:hypothetical protein
VLEDPEIHRQHRDSVVWNRVDKLRGFGGIRIEDNVLILDGGNEVLTSRFRRSESNACICQNTLKNETRSAYAVSYNATRLGRW